MLLFNNKKIKIILDNNTGTTKFDVEPYQTVKHLKEKIQNIFPFIKYEPRLLYFNKDISDDDSVILGDLFKNKQVVSIKILQPLFVSDGYEKFVPNINKPNRRKVDYLADFLPEINVTSCNNSPTVNLIKIKNANSNTNSHLITNYNANDSHRCIDNPTIYCFTCKQFSCNLCQINHRSHKNIKVELHNVEESIKIYSISLQTHLNKNLSKMKENDEFIRNNLFFDPSIRKEKIIRKLNEMEKLFVEQFKNTITIINTKTNLNQYEKIESFSNSINKEIEKIVEEISFNIINKQRNLHLDQAKKYLDLIYNKEKIIQNLIEENSNQIAYYEIYKKIDEMFNYIESNVDIICNDVRMLNKKRNKVKGFDEGIDIEVKNFHEVSKENKLFLNKNKNMNKNVLKGCLTNNAGDYAYTEPSYYLDKKVGPIQIRIPESRADSISISSIPLDTNTAYNSNFNDIINIDENNFSRQAKKKFDGVLLNNFKMS